MSLTCQFISDLTGNSDNRLSCDADRVMFIMFGKKKNLPDLTFANHGRETGSVWAGVTSKFKDYLVMSEVEIVMRYFRGWMQLGIFWVVCSRALDCRRKFDLPTQVMLCIVRM